MADEYRLIPYCMVDEAVGLNDDDWLDTQKNLAGRNPRSPGCIGI